MTTILVTGASGLVGSQVTRDLVAKNFDVYSCYHIEKPQIGTIMQLDLTKQDQIISVVKSIKPEIIIHLAALTDVDMCETQKELAHLINVQATKTLAVESSKHDSFFVYVSTDYVFDGKNGMQNETDMANPLNFYGKTKLEGEHVVADSIPSYSIIRTSTPFGMHEKKKSFPIWLKDNLESKKQIPVLVDQFTSPTFVPDFSNMLIEIATKRIKGVMHVAGATRISRYKFAKIIADKFHLDNTLLKPVKIDEMKWVAPRPQDSSLDVSKAVKILDYKPQQIEQSVKHFVNQMKP